MIGSKSSGSVTPTVIGGIVASLIIGMAIILGIIWFYSDGDLYARGYSIDISKVSDRKGAFLCGSAALPITPNISTVPEAEAQEIWLAGYSQSRPAEGVSDHIWARAVAFGYSDLMVVICSVDLIGLPYTETIAIRSMLPFDGERVHLIIAATNNHSAPDVIGWWGANGLESGVSLDYMAFLRTQIVDVVTQAVRNAQSVYVEAVSLHIGTEGLNDDSVTPGAVDEEMSIIRFLSNSSGKTVATIVSGTNQPSMSGPEERLISSGFSGRLCQGVEDGVTRWDGNSIDGIDGVCLYLTGGTHGGDMADTLHVERRVGSGTVSDTSLERKYLLADAMAYAVLEKLERLETEEKNPAMSLIARTIYVPLRNSHYRLAARLGVIGRGFVGSGVRSEVDLVSLGHVTFLTLPGRIAPEFVGIENGLLSDSTLSSTVSRDPHLKSMMPQGVRVVVALGNDDLGEFFTEASRGEQRQKLVDGRESGSEGVGHNSAVAVYRAATQILVEGKSLR